MGYILTLYMSHYSRMIVLCSRCRVNRSTNLSVFLYYVIFLLLPLRTVWASVLGRSQPVGCVPTVAASTLHHFLTG